MKLFFRIVQKSYEYQEKESEKIDESIECKWYVELYINILSNLLFIIIIRVKRRSNLLIIRAPLL
jgi:hypothetical protein